MLKKTLRVVRLQEFARNRKVWGVLRQLENGWFELTDGSRNLALIHESKIDFPMPAQWKQFRVPLLDTWLRDDALSCPANGPDCGGCESCGTEP